MLLLFGVQIESLDKNLADMPSIEFFNNIERIGTLFDITADSGYGILIIDTNDFIDYNAMKMRNGDPIFIDNILEEAIKPYSDIGITLSIKEELPWTVETIKHLKYSIKNCKDVYTHRFSRIIMSFDTEKISFFYKSGKESDTKIINEDFSQEISRIRENKNEKTFIGHPTNYIFTSFYDFDIPFYVKNLLYELSQYERVLSNYVYQPTHGDITSLLSGLLRGHNILLDATLIKSVNVEDNTLYSYAINRIHPMWIYKSKCLFFIKCSSEAIMMSTLSTLSAYNLTNFTIISNTSLDYNETIKLAKNILQEQYQIEDDNIIEKIIEQSGYDKREKYHISDIQYRTKVITQDYKMITIFDNYQKSHEKTRNTLIHDKNADDKFKYFIGLEEPKRLLKNIIQVEKFGEWMKSHHHRISDLSNHMVFTGNPGTGKTTMAKIFAEALYECNILSKNEIVHVGRSDLVGKYVGWTASKVKEKFNEAKGGVLFIDEAYSLIDAHKNSFGDEAINTIVDEMEKNRHDVIVIFAGYTQPMKDFVDINPGLKSRISFWIDFPDYSIDELCEILKVIIENKFHMRITNAAAKYCREIFQKHINDTDFGNARFARNLAHQLLISHSVRVKDHFSIDDRDMVTITKKDAENINLNEISSKNNHIGFDY